MPRPKRKRYRPRRTNPRNVPSQPVRDRISRQPRTVQYRNRNGQLITVENVANGVLTVPIGDIQETPERFRVTTPESEQRISQAVELLGWYDCPLTYLTRIPPERPIVLRPEHSAEYREQQTKRIGAIRLLNGHLRKKFLIDRFGPDFPVTVILTDLTPAEGIVAMVANDAIGALAEINQNRLAELVESVGEINGPLGEMIADMIGATGLEIDETETPPEYRCPCCSHRFGPDREPPLIGTPADRKRYRDGGKPPREPRNG